jgi:hypothetical protein
MGSQMEFIFLDVKAASRAWKMLLLARIDDRHIHFLAKPDTNLGEMRAANILESSDTIQEGFRGLWLGAGMGLIAGLLALAFPPWYVESHWAVILLITSAFGSVVGAFGMALMGRGLSNPDLDIYRTQIDAGGDLPPIAIPTWSSEIRLQG